MTWLHVFCMFCVDGWMKRGCSMNISKEIDIHHIGKRVNDGNIQCNPYLLVGEEATVLFEPGNVRDFDVVSKNLQTLADISQVTHCIISHPDVDLAGSLPLFEKAGMKAKIITSQTSLDFLRYYGIDSEIITIESLNFGLRVSEDRTLSFIPTPFLHHPGSFMTYDEMTRSLFSGDLFSAVDHQYETQVDPSYLEKMRAFHERYMPSSDFLRPIMKSLSKMQIDRILPQHGTPIGKEWVDSVIRTLYDLDFYNNRYVMEDKKREKQALNFISMLEHMLIRLKTITDERDILDVFADSEIKLNPKTLSIEETSLEKYKLWNYFFHHIYVKKGLKWLLVLESLVKRYVRMHHIKRPTIYASRLKDKLEEVDTLSENQIALEKEIEAMGDRLKQDKEKIKQSRIGGLYNEDTLREMLKEDFKKEDFNNHALIIVQIRELNLINQKYSSEQGDETLRKLAQIIDGAVKDKAHVFKQNGPGLLVYFKDTRMDEIRDVYGKIRYETGHSDLFIEDISLKAGGVFFAEINADSPLEKIDLAFQKAEQRLRLSDEKSKAGVVFSNIEGGYTPGSILLIDEDEINQGIVSRIFKREGYDILIRNDVYQALETIENETVDIIISEINLAKLDGFALKDKLNVSGNHSDIPFIMISHNKTPTTIRRANELGVECVLEKPIYADELLGIIRRVQSRRRYR